MFDRFDRGSREEGGKENADLQIGKLIFAEGEGC